MRFTLLGLVLALQAGGVLSGVVGAPPPPPQPPPPPPPAGLTVVWTAEYVDVDGVLQKTTINNDGSTVINIHQYAEVTFDARDSRSTSTGCDTDEGAAQLMGFGAHWGESFGTNWSTSGLSRDFDIGPPILPHCYENAGAKSTMLYVRDPDARESAVMVTVNVQPLGSIVDLSSGSGWPTTWVDHTVYGLTSGNYLSWGDLAMAGKRGIRIVKIGGGSDPIIARFIPDSRGFNTGYNVTDRSSDIVLVDIDYQKFATGTVGSTYCGSVRGHCRYFGDGYKDPLTYYYDQAIASNNAISAGNCRNQRGTFIVNGGVVGTGAGGGEDQYCLIGGGRAFNLAGTSFVRTTGNGSGNPMRTYMDSTVLRHIQVYSTTECAHMLKGSLNPCVYSPTPTDPWPDDDTVGDFATSRALYVAHGSGYEGRWGTGGRYFWVCDSLIGGPGMWVSTFICGWGPQNPDAPTNGLTGPWGNEDCYESAHIGGYERNRLTYNTSSGLPLGGRYLSARGNTQLNGSPWSVATGYNAPRTHPDYRGPYIMTPRPVHSTLAALL